MSTPVLHTQHSCLDSYTNELNQFKGRGYQAAKHSDIQQLERRQYLVKFSRRATTQIVIYYRE